MLPPKKAAYLTFQCRLLHFISMIFQILAGLLHAVVPSDRGIITPIQHLPSAVASGRRLTLVMPPSSSLTYHIELLMSI
jgi:hypothetical protein